MPLGICTKILCKPERRLHTRVRWSALPARTRLGQTISGLFKRYVIPFVAPRAKEVGKKILGNVVKTGMEVAGDVFSGKSAKEALKERGLAGIKKESRSKTEKQGYNRMMAFWLGLLLRVCKDGTGSVHSPADANQHSTDRMGRILAADILGNAAIEFSVIGSGESSSRKNLPGQRNINHV